MPGHSGIDGNEKADQLAKIGAEQPFIGPEPVFALPTSSVKEYKRKWLKSQAVDYWARAPKMKHAKKIISKPDSKIANTLINLNRCQLRIYVMFPSGKKILFHLESSWNSRWNPAGIPNGIEPEFQAKGDALTRKFHLKFR